MTHHRSVVRLPKTGAQFSRPGKKCGPLQQTVNCNIDPCPINCAVSGWNAWSACYSPATTSCGMGTVSRHKTVTTFPMYGGKPCPSAMQQTKLCYHVGPCVGKGPSDMCGGVTPKGTPAHGGLRGIGQTDWKTFGKHGLYVDVATHRCAFNATPQYVAQLLGAEKNAFFGFLGGTSSVSRPTATGFRVQVRRGTARRFARRF